MILLTVISFPPSEVSKARWEWNIDKIERTFQELYKDANNKKMTDEEYLKTTKDRFKRFNALQKAWHGKIRLDYWKKLQNLIKWHIKKLKRLKKEGKTVPKLRIA